MSTSSGTRKRKQQQKRATAKKKILTRKTPLAMMRKDAMTPLLAMYIGFESKFLKSRSETGAIHSLQEIARMFDDVPFLAGFIGKQRVLQMARSKRKVNPKSWSQHIAKTFGKLVMSHALATRKITRQVPAKKPISVVNISEGGPIRKRGRFRGHEAKTPIHIQAPPVPKSSRKTALEILAKTACPTPK